MIQRYTRTEMGQVWSDEHKYRCWLEVELAASDALAEIGEVPKEAAAALRAHAGFDVDRIDANAKMASLGMGVPAALSTKPNDS